MKNIIGLLLISAVVLPFTAFANEQVSACDETLDPFLQARQYCQVYDAVELAKEKTIATVKSNCINFFKEAIESKNLICRHTVDMIALKASGASAEEVKNTALSYKPLYADRYVRLKKSSDSYFQSVNKLSALGKRNFMTELSCVDKPESEVASFYLIAMAEKSLRDLQYTGAAMRVAIRQAVKDVKLVSETGVVSFSRVDLAEIDFEHDAHGKVASHNEANHGTAKLDSVLKKTLERALLDKVIHAAVEAPVEKLVERELAKKALGHTGAKIMPGLAGVAVAVGYEALVYHHVDTVTMISLIGGAATGPVGGVIASYLETTYRNQQARIKLYQAFGIHELEENANLSATDLAKRFAKSLDATCHF